MGVRVCTLDKWALFPRIDIGAHGAAALLTEAFLAIEDLPVLDIGAPSRAP